jgi:hypothetical protein
MGVLGLIVPGIDNAAHLGGFAGGYVASMWLDPLKRERMDHFIGAAVCLLATAAATVTCMIIELPLLVRYLLSR